MVICGFLSRTKTVFGHFIEFRYFFIFTVFVASEHEQVASENAKSVVLNPKNDRFLKSRKTQEYLYSQLFQVCLNGVNSLTGDADQSTFILTTRTVLCEIAAQIARHCQRRIERVPSKTR